MINYLRTYQNFYGPHVFRWEFVAAETGEAIELPRMADKSIHIHGTIGGATVTLLGSNAIDQANGVVLDTTFNVPISVAALVTPYLQQIMQNPLWIWPVVVGGSPTLIIDICIKPNG